MAEQVGGERRTSERQQQQQQKPVVQKPVICKYRAEKRSGFGGARPTHTLDVVAIDWDNNNIINCVIIIVVFPFSRVSRHVTMRFNNVLLH